MADSTITTTTTTTKGPMGVGDRKQLPTLESMRESLIRQEDSIVFALIERARFPRNAPAYNRSLVPQFEGRSLTEVFVRESEALQSKEYLSCHSGFCLQLLSCEEFSSILAC